MYRLLKNKIINTLIISIPKRHILGQPVLGLYNEFGRFPGLDSNLEVAPGRKGCGFLSCVKANGQTGEQTEAPVALGLSLYSFPHAQDQDWGCGQLSCCWHPGKFIPFKLICKGGVVTPGTQWELNRLCLFSPVGPWVKCHGRRGSSELGSSPSSARIAGWVLVEVLHSPCQDSSFFPFFSFLFFSFLFFSFLFFSFLFFSFSFFLSFSEFHRKPLVIHQLHITASAPDISALLNAHHLIIPFPSHLPSSNPLFPRAQPL